jgi:S-adenosyl methyltransferase
VTQSDEITPQINPSIPHPARIYDYMLGGKDNFTADRAMAEQIFAALPEVRSSVRHNRLFLQRAVRYLAAEAGIRQFLDLGTGIPTQGNVHEVVSPIAPDSRVVYVDNDPIVHVHANALLAGDNAISILADLRQPDAILGHPEARELLDFDRPVAVLMVAILHFIPDEEDPAGIIGRFRDAIAPGSYLALSHATADFHSPEVKEKVAQMYRGASAPMVLRGRAEVERMFDGFEMVEPGLARVSTWRPEPDAAEVDAQHSSVYAGVGRKP